MKQKQKKEGIDFNLGIAILLSLAWTLLFPTNLGFCMPMPGANVDLGAVDFYRPLIHQLHEESPWAYAFTHFEELQHVIQTCRTGRLLGPDLTYELIQQLHSEQLYALVHSMFESLQYSAPPPVHQRFLLLGMELLQESHNCMGGLENMATHIATIRGIDIANQSVSDSLPALLEGFNLPPDLVRFYAGELVRNTGRLYIKYTDLLAFLYYVLP